ncbi:MAG TPA: helix-hairpin-helix domain-containing protein [Gemmatimonadaceae bacterium]|nr:helix-hairpin-helix domain-containing protein [Gemmatimonadaceae bacterium]
MPTPSERRALVLLSVVAVLGVAARLSGATRSAAVATPEQLRALDAQIARVESARTERRARTARSGGASKSSGPSGGSGAPGITTPRAPSSPAQRDARRALVDLDVADAAAIERLPWIGPALAERIVANRQRCGPFGSLEALQRVPGIGAGIARRLEPHVTFSPTSRPMSAPAGCTSAGKRAAPRDRGRSS